MSTTIDQKVVEMRFDNKQFETNVAETMSTLDKLKESLRFKGAEKGFAEVEKASEKVEMTHLGKAVDTVKMKFSALEVMGVTALTNLTNSAVNAGKRIVSALTIDPIKTGFQEYETQMNAVQTILANTKSKGTTLTDVNSALDELNTYADKTIYNFTEMTRNIGTFTAAGVDLETSVSAIKGIANLAAVSGSNAQQASTAMYQLSQALASGTVKLMDWNSVVNAGMGGQVFQDALKETAKLHGKNVDAMIEKEGSFRETLKNEWLTADILTETLAKFTGDLDEAALKSKGYTDDQIKEIIELGKMANDAATKVKTLTQLWDTLKEAAQSGWSQSWKIVVGDFEESKVLFTEISDTLGALIGASAESRNAVLQGWKDLGGRTAIIDAIRNAFEGVMSIIKPIGEAFREIFPPVTAQQLLAFSEALKNLTAKLILTDEQAAKLKSTFKGVFAVADIIVTVIKKVISGAVKIVGSILGLGDGLLDITGSLGDFLVGLRNTVKESNLLGSTIDAIVGFIQIAINKFKEFTGYLKEKIDMPGVDGLLVFLGGIKTVIQKIGDKFVEVFRNGDIKTLGDILNTGLFAGVLIGIKKFVKSLTSITEDAGGLFENLKGILEDVRGCLEAYQQNLQANVILKIAIAVGILAASLLTIAMIDPAKIESSLGALTVVITELMLAMAAFTKIGGLSKGAMGASSVMISLSIAVFVLASALKKISDLSVNELIKGVSGIFALTAIMVASAKLMSNDSKKMIKGAGQMVIFAAALKILASACKDLSQLSVKELAKGLISVGVLMAGISLFLNNTTFSGKSMGAALGIVLLASAIKILASACADFALMSVEGIAKGLISIGLILAGLVGLTKFTGNTNQLLSIGVSMIAIAAAMKIFADAIQPIAALSWESLLKGLAGMAVVLIAVTVAFNNMPKNMISIGAGLIAVSAALVLMSTALEHLGNMSWDEIGKGLIVLGTSMLILALGLKSMSSSLSGSAALLVAAAAIMVLTPALKMLGSMGWTEIVKGLVAIAGAFTVIGLAGLLLSPIAGSIALVGAAILALGAGCALAGVGITTIAAGISALAVSLVAACAAIVESIVIIVDGLGEIIAAACNAIIVAAPALAKAFVVLIQAACFAITESVPVIAETLFKVLVTGLELINKYIPRIVSIVADILINILNALTVKLPELMPAFVQFIGAFLSELDKALGEGGLKGLIDSLYSIAAIFVALGLTAKIVSTIPLSGALQGIASLAIFIGGVAGILAALGALTKIPGFNWIIDEGSKVLGKIGTAIGTFVGNIAGGFLSGVTNSFPTVGKNLSDFMINATPFVEGIKKIDSSALSGAASLAGAILCITAADVINGLTSWLTGGTSMSDFGEQVAELGPYLRQFADSVSGLDTNAVKNAADASMSLAKMAASVPNEGGMVAWFTGDNSLGKFAPQVKQFGKALKGFADGVRGLSADSVKEAAKAGKHISEMAASVPNEGGMVAWFTGDNSLGNFAPLVKKFGKALKSFSDEVRGIEPEAIKEAATAGKHIAEMAESVPNEGGMVAWFTGDNSLGRFGPQVKKFGKALKEFSNEVRGVDPTAISQAAKAGKSITEMADSVPNEGGMVAWFTGDNSLGRFAPQVKKFGKALKSFSDEVQGIDSSSTNEAVKTAKAIVNLSNQIPNEGGMVAWFTGDNTLGDFAPQIKKLGTALKSFSDSVKGADATSVSAATDILIAISKLPVDVDNYDFSGFYASEAQLGKLGTGISEFSKNTKGISTDEAARLEVLISYIGRFADMVQRTSGIKISGIGDFGPSMKSLGEGMANFANATAWVGDTSNLGVMIQHADSFADMIVKLSKINSNSLLTPLPSIKPTVDTLGGLGHIVKELSSAMSEFATSVGNMSDESLARVGSTVEYANSFIDMLQKLSTVGYADLNAAAISITMEHLGYGLSSFASHVSWIDDSLSSRLNSMTELATTFSSIMTELASVGYADLNAAAISITMEHLGYGLSSFASYVSWIDDSLKGKLDMLSDIAGKFPAMLTALASVGYADLNASAMSITMEHLGYGLSSFASYVGWIDQATVTNLGSIVDAAGKFPPIITALSSAGYANIDAAKLSATMTAIGTGLNGFATQIVNVGLAEIQSAITAAGEFPGVISGFIGLNVEDANAVGSEMASLGTNLKNFYDKVSGINDYASFDTAIVKMGNLITVAGQLTTIDATKIEGFGTSVKNAFSNLGDVSLDNFILAFENATEEVKTAADNLASVVESTIKTADWYTRFKSIGSYIVDGIVAGIDENTYKAEAEARAMADAADKAAREALGVESPSKNFALIGQYVVEGLANGIKNNVKVAEKSSTSLGLSILNAIQKKLGIHSPSIVFEKEVGRWIVRGIAEGITKDMSAEEAMIKKAQNVQDAFKKAYGQIDTLEELNQANYDNWLAKNPNATDDEKIAKQRELIDKKIAINAQEKTYALSEYLETKKLYEDGQVTEQSMQEAWIRYLKLDTEGIELINDRNELLDEQAKKREETAKKLKGLDDETRDLDWEIWQSQNADATGTKLKKEIEYLKDVQQDLINNSPKLQAAWENAVAKYGADSIEAKEAYNAMLKNTKEINNISNQIRDINKDTAENLKALNDEDRDLKWEIWQSQNADATGAKLEKEVDYLTDVQQGLIDDSYKLYDAWVKAVAKYGEDSAEAKEAYNDLLANTKEINSIGKQIHDINEETEDLMKGLNEEARDLDWELWQSQNPKATGEKSKKEIEYLEKVQRDLIEDRVGLENDWKNAVAKYGEDSAEALAAANAIRENEIEQNKITNKISDIREDTAENLRALDEENRDLQWEIWQGQNPKATYVEKAKAETEYLTDVQQDLIADSYELYDAWKNAVAQYGADSEEAKAAFNAALANTKEINEVSNKISDIEEDTIENDKKIAENKRSLAQSIADTEYDIWEKTLGKNATEAEKDTRKLESLTKKMSTQTQIVDAALSEWLEAKKEFGEDSAEALEAYSVYLDKELELANINSDIIDINERNAKRQKDQQDRQKIAERDYKNYIEKYREYYLKNGMSLADLERDAMLTSGYDPNSTVDTILDETNKDLNNLDNNSQYQNIQNSATNIGNTVVTAINDGVKTATPTAVDSAVDMSSQCVEAIKETQPEWITAGNHLVDGFAYGIQSHMQAAIDMAEQMADKVIVATNGVFGINSTSVTEKATSEIEYLEKVRQGLIGDSSKLRAALKNAVGINSTAAAQYGADSEEVKAAFNVVNNLENSIKRISELVESGIDTEPTIRPVLDLSNVESGIDMLDARLNTMFSRYQALRISTGMYRNQTDEGQNGINGPSKTGNTYEFNQYNYSPKALSRADLYRQTKNQFATMKEVLK